MKVKAVIIFSALLIAPSLALASGVDDIATTIAKERSISTEEARVQVEKVFGAVGAELREGRDVTIKNFGKFYVQERQARMARNPKTGAPVSVGAKRYARFVSADGLKNSLNPQSVKAVTTNPQSAAEVNDDIEEEAIPERSVSESSK